MNDKEKADLAFLSMEPPKNYETWKNIGISYEPLEATTTRSSAGAPTTPRSTTSRYPQALRACGRGR